MNWVDTKVGDFSPFVYGKAIAKKDQLSEGVPVFGSNGIYTYSSKPLVGPFAVIIGRKGTVGKVHISEKPCWVSDTAFYIQYDNIEEAYFSYYLLSSLGLEDMNTDAAVPGLNRDNAHRLEVKIPETTEQRRQLVEPLIKLDNKIQINQQINQTLEQMAQAIFKSWFVDFDPVKAKIAALEAGGSDEDALIAAMQAISGKDADQLATMQANQPEQYAELCATAELFPSAMQESELGEIPEGWAFESLTNFGQVVCGKTPPKSKKEYFGGDVPFIKIPDMHGGAFNTKYSEYLSDAGGNSQPKKYIPAGSICVSCIATVGKVLLTHRKSQTNQQINSIVPKSQFLREYLYFQMTEKNKLLHDLASGGSATLNLNTGNFSKIELLMPSEVILARYSGVVSSLFSEILQNCIANETLTEMRDSLLPKLLSGEISVDSIYSDLTEEHLNAMEVN